MSENEIAKEAVDAAFKILSSKPWENHRTLAEYLLAGEDDGRVAKVAGRLVRIRTRDYYAYRQQALVEAVRHYAPDGIPVVELGCGHGINLFALHLTGRWPRLVGLDISPNAIAAARATAAHFGLTGLHFDVLDITDSAAPLFGLLRDRLVLTCYCLEQLKYETRTVLQNIQAARPRRVVHIEPSVEHLRWSSASDLINWLYILRRDYQDNLLRTLQTLAGRGLLSIVEVQRLDHAPGPRHEPLLVCWEPK